MPQTNPTNRSGMLARIAGVSLLSLLAAACAADSQRFAGFSGNDGMTTGSLPPADVPGAAPAPAYGGGSYGAGGFGANPAGAPRPAAATAGPAQQGFTGVRPEQVSGSAAGWTAAGGARVSVGPGDTVQAIADRYGVPPAAIRAANNLAGQSLTPGSAIIIPVYNPAAAAQTAAAAAAPAVPPPPARPAAKQDPAARSVAERAAQAIAASRAAEQQPRQQAAARGAPPRTLQEQAAARQQAARQAQQARETAAQQQARQAQQAASARTTVGQAQQPAATPKQQTAKLTEEVAPAPREEARRETQEAPAKQAASGPTFRWPARGRIIQGFNAGAGNEGINIALPEGTPVKAAESGVVAYAGNELKGYGNLVLIRHDNGWVSAYANNGELKVKRGDRVSRGQVVATSGQTGNVATPQLHFELRKGSTPVDPLPHLSGG
ncbi:peptidoglycan DD-metalloendopeptidase family protein [Camelimonas abortus]